MNFSPLFRPFHTLPSIFALSLLALTLVGPASASAQTNPWTKRSAGGGALIAGVSSPDGEHVFLAGYTVNLSWQNVLTPITPAFFVSTNGGLSFRNITGTAGAASAHPPGGIHFLDAVTGWVAVGKDVFRTDDGGTSWVKTTAPDVIHTLHFFDSQRGVAAGADGAILLTTDGGVTWTARASGTTSPLHRQFWVGDRHGWLLGNKESIEEEDAGRPSDPVVLRTTDGGETWAAATTLPTVQGLDSVYFLRDGVTGFVAGYTWSDDDSRDAVLLKTTDGGATFTPMNLPIDVGSVNLGFGGDMPIQFSHVRAMYWEDAQRGHLAGIAFMMKTSSGGSGGGGGEKTEWRVVDFVTDDGGETWTKTNIGKLTGNIISPPTGDGWVGPGLLRDLHSGWMGAEGGQVWLHSRSCTAADECGDGYLCNDAKRCERRASPDDACLPSCASGMSCVDGACVSPDDGSGDGGWGTGGGSGGDGSIDGPNDTDEPGGCDCSSAPLSGVWLAFAAVMLRRRRRPAGR